MEFLDNKTPKYELDNINVLVLAGMSTNKAEPVKVNGYVVIAVNDEAANNFEIVRFKSVPYTLQEYV